MLRVRFEFKKVNGAVRFSKFISALRFIKILLNSEIVYVDVVKNLFQY